MTRQIFPFSAILVAGWVLLVGAALLSACAQPATQAPAAAEAPAAATEAVVVEAPAACPPIQERVSASLPGELTRIMIPAGAIALSDPGNRAWCDTSQLKLAKASVSELVSANGCFTDRNDTSSPCSVYNALAAVDIQPGWVKFTSPSDVMLVYDLSNTENRPYCTGTGGDCGGYAIYQLKSSLPPAPALAWRYASPASPVSGSTPASAVGRIDRLSTLALVELPPPQLFPMVITSALTVDSEFIPDQPENPGAFSVAFLIRDDTLGMKDQTRLFRFSDPEMLLSVSGAYPAECLVADAYPSVAEQLTCLFPSGMEVILVNGAEDVANQVSIAPVAGEYEARLSATLEVY